MEHLPVERFPKEDMLRYDAVIVLSVGHGLFHYSIALMIIDQSYK
jgi:hypothetical protein